MAQDSQPKIVPLYSFRLVEQPSTETAFLLQQVHGNKGHLRTHGDLINLRPEGDWHWTLESELRLGILVADCTAVMISGRMQNGDPFVAGLHAGWRGTAASIIENFHQTVCPRDGWIAWLSPSICESHFEVGPEVVTALGEDLASQRLSQHSGKYLFDLKQNQIKRIEKLAGAVTSDVRCTYCESDLVSYRQSGAQLKARHLAEISFCLR